MLHKLIDWACGNSRAPRKRRDIRWAQPFSTAVQQLEVRAVLKKPSSSCLPAGIYTEIVPILEPPEQVTVTDLGGIQTVRFFHFDYDSIPMKIECKKDGLIVLKSISRGINVTVLMEEKGFGQYDYVFQIKEKGHKKVTGGGTMVNSAT